MNLTVKPATRFNVEFVASRLREEDYQEVRIATGRNPLDVVKESAMLSGTDVVALGGVAVALVGTAPHPQHAGVGIVWMLCTEGVRQGPRAILRYARRWLAERHETYEVLTNAAWAGNALHLGWLRLLGFTLLPPVLVNGAEFIPFHRSKEDPFHV